MKSRDRRLICRHFLFAYSTALLSSSLISGLEFTQEPGNHIAVEGHPTWWHCLADSDLPVTFTWFHNSNPVNGQPNFEVLANGTLHIITVSQSEIGTYRCQARTSQGEIITSREALLSLASIGHAFSISPQSQRQNLGSSVSLHCTIASNPQAVISWLFNGGDLVAGTTVTTTTVDSTTRCTLTVSALEHKHGGQYRCLATNHLLPNAAVFSETATLVLIGRPGFTVTPSPDTVAVSGSIILHCQATGNPSATVQWLNPTGTIIQSSGRFTSTSTTLRITNIQMSDAGFYTCQATNEWGTNTASALLTVTQAVEQVVFTTTPSDQSVSIGSRVTLPCGATGSPDPVIAWSKQGGNLPSGRIEEPTAGWLRISNVMATDSGVYVCTASNGLSSISSQAQLIVLVPPSFTASPVDTTARAGESAFFQCQAEGNPAPAITWTTPTTSPLQAPSGPHSGVEVTADGTLMISPVQRHHAGSYVCTAINTVSAISQSATLDVHSPPVLTTLPTDQRVILGSTVQLSCRADASPSPRIVWLFNNTLVGNDPKHTVYGNGDLTLVNVAKVQEGSYTCQAQNSLGLVEMSAFVVILIPPDFVVYPLDTIVKLGDSVLLDCVSTGDPTPALQWLKDNQLLVLEPNIATLANFSLLLANITEPNLGTYTCLATNEAGTNQISADVLTPEIPYFILPPTNTTANESMSAILTCRASARREPTIHWYLADSNGIRGTEVGLGTNRAGSRGASSFVAADGSLTFFRVSRQDEGLYMCVATNGIGSISEVAHLFVNIPPSIISVTSPVSIPDTASHALLQCLVEGRPTPHLTWFLPSGDLVPNDPSRYNARSDNGYLVVYNPSVREHDGDFLCLAENFLGNDTAVVTVVVQGAPILTQVFSARSNDSVTLQCLAKGSPSPVHKWSRNGLEVNTGLSSHFLRRDGALVIQDHDLAETETYECTVENDHGAESAAFKVPDVPGTPQVGIITPISIDLTWSPPSPNSNLSLSGYQLEYIRFMETNYQEFSGVISDSVVMVTGLVPYTGYGFRVRAFNTLGSGAFSPATSFVLTAEGVPSEPEDLLVAPSGDILTVSWSPPESLNGNPENIVYQIAYKLQDGRPDQETILTHGHNETPYSVLIEGTRRNTNYRVRIRAGNTLLGDWSSYVSKDVRTLVEAPARIVDGVQAVALGSTVIRVQWDSVNDASFDHYNIAFRQLNSNMSFGTVQITNASSTNFTIHGLRENTNYAVKMSYSNAGGQGPYSPEVLVMTKLNPPGGHTGTSLSGGVLAAIICAAVAIVLLLVILILILCQRRNSPTGWIGRKRLNPDALWIHKRYSYGDEHSFDSYPDDSSGNSGQKGTYNVSVVNENYQADDTVGSTDSAYDLQGSGNSPVSEKGQKKKKKKKKKKTRDWSDVIYRSRKDPGVVLVKQAVLGDSDFNPPPVPLTDQTLSEDEAARLPENEGERKKDVDPTDSDIQDPVISTISSEFPIESEFPVHEAAFAEFLDLREDGVEDGGEFPVFPNANDSLNLAAELNVDRKQMRKMARKAEREQKRREKKECKELEGVSSVGQRKRKLSDRISQRLKPLGKRGSLNLDGQGKGGKDAADKGDSTMMERQKENAAMF